MLNRYASCLLLFLIGSSAVAQDVKMPQGSICGIVLDENGLPASSVKVCPFYMGSHSGGVPVTRTDKQGQYCFRGLVLGDYSMTADDPEKGYPSMANLFFSTDPMPHVELSATNSNGRVDWKIPYKAGFVKVDLVDAQSGKQIVPMFFDLLVQSRPQVGHMYGSAMSTIPLLVPPYENVVVTIHAPDYQQDTNEESQRTIVNLSPGEMKKLHIALRPAEATK